MLKWKEAVVVKFKVGYYPGIWPQELRQTNENLSQNSVSPGRDMNPGRVFSCCKGSRRISYFQNFLVKC
jgi:hypothetical protein